MAVRGIGGYRDANSGRAEALIFGLGTVKTLVLKLWMALYFPINWSREPGPWLTAAMLVYVGALAWLAAGRPKRVIIASAVGFILVSAIPPLHLLGISADLWNSRLLYLPSVGFSFALAGAVDGLRGRGRWIVPAVILAFHFAALQHNLAQWERVSDGARSGTSVAVECVGADTKRITDFGVPGTLRGVPFFLNAFSDQLRFVVDKQEYVVLSPTPKHGHSATLLWDGPSERLRCVEIGLAPGK